ncbi:MAG TPA: histidine kinase dimerization/phospho-acceptor domain-containing protein, partial [Nitrospirota bacterium]|nr:histidine kinase dimerization/phospho-acceptor domain-containing protein [Nitrospirota bacterium]
MLSALILVTALVGAFFYWENRKSLDAEVRGRALMLSRVLSALTIEDIITGNKHGIYKKIEAHFSHGDGLSSSDLMYLMVYNRDGYLLVGSSETAVFFDSSTYFYTLPSKQHTVIEDASLSMSARKATVPVFDKRASGVYDVTSPIMASNDRVGFVRVGISSAELASKSSAVLRRGAAALLGVLLVSMAFSQIITIGITKPIRNISKAVEQVGQQNWDVSPPETGKDEISKLGQAFHQMAVTLQHREQNVSNWNRDLFLLHTAGLELMESLDLATLVPKILGRTEDLVRADIVALSAVDASTGMLTYLGVSGERARALKDLELPLEAGGVYNWMASYGTPLLIADARSDFRMDGELMSELGIRGIMVVPIWSSNMLRGMLTAINKKGGAAFDKHDLRLFTVFSSLAGAALQNASLYTDLKQSLEVLKSTQEQLVHSSKMAAIGELSANIAHEINNPLTSVLGYTSHLIRTLALPEESRRTLLMMEQETLRMRKIIRNLLDFARQKPSWLRPSD